MTSEPEKKIRLIVGLGNPGGEYAPTRHNAGSWYLEKLAEVLQVKLKRETEFKSKFVTTTIEGEQVHLLIPRTFMNLNGTAVASVVRFFRLTPQEILIAHDDLDLPPGTVKLKSGGGHGGHNGLRDVIQRIGQQNGFYRLRLGIGHPGVSDQVVEFVLGMPTDSEKQRISMAIDRAVGATPSIINLHLDEARRRLTLP